MFFGAKHNKFTASVLALTVMVSLWPNIVYASQRTVYNEDFETAEIGTVPSGFVYESGMGSVGVTDENGNKRLWLRNDADGSYTYLEYPEFSLSGSVCEFGFDFLQYNAKSTESVPFELKSESSVVVRIHSEGNNIVYDTNTVKHESKVLVQDYHVNKWYSFTVGIDLNTGEASVTVNGKKYDELPLLADTKTLTGVTAYSAYSPGFMLDNLSLKAETDISSVTIRGENNLKIPESGESEYVFYASAFDAEGSELDGEDISFSFEPELPFGVTSSVKGNKLVLTVSGAAPETDFTVKVSTGETEASKTVTLRHGEVSDVKILGANRITYIKGRKTEYKYECKFYDEAGNELSKSYSWKLKSAPEGVEFDPDSGILTVSRNMTNNTYAVLEAVCDEDMSVRTEKRIAALDIYTYRTDEQRMNAVLEYVDKILVSASDKYRGTPLLANGIDVDTGQHVTLKHIKDAYHPNEIIVPSDIARQYNFMRTLYGLSEITGDARYRRRAEAVYRYYIDAGYYSKTNGLLYLGGHCCLDLATGNVNYAGGRVAIHEYKNHFGFYDPWFEIDSEFAEKYIKAIFAAHFYDTKCLFFNRHASFDKKHSTDNIFSDLNAYDDSDMSVIRDCTGLTFRNAGNDMMFALLELYEHTGDKNALTWAKRLLDRYIALQDPVTNISVYQFNTAYGDPNCKELPSEWWLRDDYSTFTNSNYGDRLQNQYADDWIAKGYFDESERDKIIEGNWLDGVSGAYGSANLIDLKMADAIGMDTEDGSFYAKNTLKAMAGVIKYGYIPQKNEFHTMLNDGTVFTGYQSVRNGYYGKIGSVITTSSPPDDFFYAAVKVFFQCKDMEGLDEEKKYLWDFIRNFAIVKGLGDFGESIDDDIKEDMSISTSDPKLLIAVLELYRETNNYDYLNLARMIGNNIVEKNITNGYFVAGSSYKYSELDDFYAYSLVMLDAATRGDFTSVPKTYLGKGYFHTTYVDERGRDMPEAFDYNFLWALNRKSILVKRIITDKNEYVMNLGEKEKLNISVYPDDASSSAINWYSENPAVAAVDEDGTLFARGIGTVKITGISNDLNARTQISVTVTNTETEEKPENG